MMKVRLPKKISWSKCKRHRARLDGSILQNLSNKDAVQFREVMPNRPPQPQTAQAPQQQGIPASYLNYAEQLLEQMRGVYASSWDNCGCGTAGIIIFMTHVAELTLHRQAAAAPTLTAPATPAAMTTLYRPDQNPSHFARRQCQTAAAAPPLITMTAPLNCSNCAIN